MLPTWWIVCASTSRIVCSFHVFIEPVEQHVCFSRFCSRSFRICSALCRPVATCSVVLHPLPMIVCSRRDRVALRYRYLYTCSISTSGRADRGSKFAGVGAGSEACGEWSPREWFMPCTMNGTMTCDRPLLLHRACRQPPSSWLAFDSPELQASLISAVACVTVGTSDRVRSGNPLPGTGPGGPQHCGSRQLPNERAASLRIDHIQ